MTVKEPETPKVNNYFNEKVENSGDQFKYVIYFETLLGINRLYMLNVSKTILYTTRIYNFILIITVLYFITVHDIEVVASYLVFKYTASIELFLLIASSICLFEKKSLSVTRKLSQVDEMLNVLHEPSLTTSTSKRACTWLVANFIYNIAEVIFMKIYLSQFVTPTTLILYIPILAHECEQIFFCSILRTVFMRLTIVRAHADKVIRSVDDIDNLDKREADNITALSNNTTLDVTSLHRVYETLHHCSEHINSIMNFPMLIMLISSGISTTFMLKNFISLTQVDVNSNIPLTYFIARCVKYTLLVFAPCIYCSLTSGHVKAIRTDLYDAVNNARLDRIERRKLKAFLQLTRDSEFKYALWGVIDIDMSLPLSYFSICTTYLVIIIQFSKFID